MTQPPANTVLSVEQGDGLERIVMDHPTGTGARLFLWAFIVGAFLLDLWVWFDAVLELIGESGFGFEALLVFIFTSLIGFVLLMVMRTAFRPRVPESITLTSDGLIHDGGVDPFRLTHLERSNRQRRNEQFTSRRERVFFTRAEASQMSMVDQPYVNRIVIKRGGDRHDIGEALSASERTWLFDFLTTRLRDAPPAPSAEAQVLRSTVEMEAAKPPSVVSVARVFSDHRVDPLDFKESIAREAEWSPLQTTSAGFKTRMLVRGTGTLRLKATPAARSMAMTMLLMGMIAVALAVREFLSRGLAIESGFPFVVGGIFVLVGIWLFYDSFRPIVFDLRRGTFRRGWSPRSLPLSEVGGVQLLSFESVGESMYTAFELNLLLHDGTRVHVVCHGDRAAIEHQGETIGGLVGKPVFNGILAGAESSRVSKPTETSGGLVDWLLIHVPPVVLFALFLMIPFLPVGEKFNSNSNPVDAATAQDRGPARTASVRQLADTQALLEQSRTRLPAARRHEIYRELVDRRNNTALTSPELRVIILLDAGEFYLGNVLLESPEIEGLFREALDVIGSHEDLAFATERARRGLEKVFLWNADYAAAAEQVEALITFYEDLHAGEPAVITALTTPTLNRLARWRALAGDSVQETPAGGLGSPGYRLAFPPGVAQPRGPRSFSADQELREALLALELEEISLNRVKAEAGLCDVRGYAATPRLITDLVRKLNAEFGIAYQVQSRSTGRAGAQAHEFMITVKASIRADRVMGSG